MSSHRALVVDDSKTAQHRLKRMLTRYDIDVDTAVSAEQALGYLSHTLPAVIFMDHHMEGMDGFEALKIIKANPSTAMIPVIMYTSQSGDVYVGRAHALGALDILSKEVIKPSSLEAVLAKLKIHRMDTQENTDETSSNISTSSETGVTLEAAAADTTSSTAHTPIESPHENENEVQAVSQVNEPLNTPTPSEPEQAPTDKRDDDKVKSTEEISELRNQVARLFELHIADVRTQVTENTKFMVRRLTSEIKSATATKRNAEAVDSEFEAGRINDTQSQRSLAPLYVLLTVILIIVTALSIKTFQPTIQSDGATQADMSEIKSELQALAKRPSINDSMPLIPGPPIDMYGLIEAIGIAADLDAQFPFGVPPINSDNQLIIQTLIEKMDFSGFKGFVEISVHFGNFCVTASSNGDWVLAKENSLAEQCVFTNDQPVETQETWLAQAYSDLEALSDPIKRGDIELAVSLAPSLPNKHDYPDLQQNTTAAQWNSIALKNNYLSIRFESAE